MLNFFEDCEFVELSKDSLIENFDCGDSDLNEFFNHDAVLFRNEFLGRTYFFRDIETQKIVCCFSLCADSVKTILMPGSRKKKVKELIPREKDYLQSFPSFLIGRLGVSVEYGNMGIGSKLLNYIKMFSLEKFPYFGRFLVVDAYNKPDILSFYEKNNFKFVFSSETQEREYLKKDLKTDDTLHTRQMFYDLKRYE